LPDKVAARAWCRVDLGGGTLDIWPLGLLHHGARTVNAAVDIPVHVELTRAPKGYCVRQGGEVVEAETAAELTKSSETALIGHIAVAFDLPPLVLEIHSASPRGAGLGASSALAVATIAAAEVLLDRGESSVEKRAALARDLEARLMGLPTGRQDHFPALMGGVLEIVHRPGGERIRQLAVDVSSLGNSLVIAYTGQSHFSAGNNWRIIRRRLEGDAEVVQLFDGIRDAAELMPAALEAGDLQRVAELMADEWRHRRRLAEGISTPRIEELLEIAERAGAWGGKACGAGGGGCIALLCPPARRRAVAQALEEKGAQVLAAQPAPGPLQIESH
jgi:D-glycero-alpha-D-manno-heptose-7-phosphate kinase